VDRKGSLVAVGLMRSVLGRSLSSALFIQSRLHLRHTASCESYIRATEILAKVINSEDENCSVCRNG
jgi:hypothetical protein